METRHLSPLPNPHTSWVCAEAPPSEGPQPVHIVPASSAGGGSTLRAASSRRTLAETTDRGSGGSSFDDLASGSEPAVPLLAAVASASEEHSIEEGLLTVSAARLQVRARSAVCSLFLAFDHWMSALHFSSPPQACSLQSRFASLEKSLACLQTNLVSLGSRSASVCTNKDTCVAHAASHATCVLPRASCACPCFKRSCHLKKQACNAHQQQGPCSHQVSLTIRAVFLSNRSVIARCGAACRAELAALQGRWWRAPVHQMTSFKVSWASRTLL